ncbi:MAG: rhamnogalacturonan acetylesterase [Candidatus Hydrogenedentes bacterium]|nr:rhamnogalacturonan acetylesterase [Candidatus Hydrogenedentota bacterium]
MSCLQLNCRIIVLAVLFALPSLAGYADDVSVPRLYVIGDSTAASYAEDRAPLTGWAQVLQDYLDPACIVVDDRARSGRSSKSFMEEGAWAPIREALKPGDYVFIQFGHNDQKQNDPARYTDPATSYRAFLTQYVSETRDAGSIPVLLTSINRNGWNESGEFIDGMGAYPDAVRAVAREMETPLIDLHRLTRERFESIGPERTRDLFLYLEKGESPNYPDGKADGTHLCTEGAYEISGLVAGAILETGLPLRNCVLAHERSQTPTAKEE